MIQAKGRGVTLVVIPGLVLVALVLALVVGVSTAFADEAKGKQVYDGVCAVCHGFEGKGGPIAPPLAKDLSYFKDVGLPKEAVVPVLLQATKERPPGAIMPVYNPDKVNDAQVADIGDYLWSLVPAPAAVIPPGSADKGGAPYAANCAACHGATGIGGTAPPLAAIAAGMKAGGAPPAVMHALVRLATRSGALPSMPTFAADKLSDAQLADIAAFIWELPPPPALPATGGLGLPQGSFWLIVALGAILLGSGWAIRRRVRA